MLRAHPQAHVAPEKELDFFSYYFDRGYRWYESLFDGAAAAVRFENSPSYFHDPRAPERVHGYDPAMKIVLLLRDPVERAYSNHLHEVIKGHIPPDLSFEDGLENNPSYLEQSRYGTHLGRWLQVFPRDQVLVLLAEHIGRDPAEAARQLYRFLGIDADFTTGLLSERRNESDRARWPWLRHLLRAQGDRMRAMGWEEHLMRIKKLPPFRQVLASNRIDVRAQVPPMRPRTRQRLVDELADEMQVTARLLGRDPVEWPSWPGSPS